MRRAGSVAHLSFQRPERRNALNHDMMREIGDAVDRVGADRKARALVLRGAGGAFCAGGDLGAMSDMPPLPARGPDPLVAPYRYFGEVLERLNRLPQAVISVVEGPAVGGGLGTKKGSESISGNKWATQAAGETDADPLFAHRPARPGRGVAAARKLPLPEWIGEILCKRSRRRSG